MGVSEHARHCHVPVPECPICCQVERKEPEPYWWELDPPEEED